MHKGKGMWQQLEGQGLPEPEAQVVGALAAHGIAADADGDVTAGAFDEFTAGMAFEEFTAAAVRGREVVRAGA